MKYRDAKIDNIKGALMLLIIFGHMIEPLVDTHASLSKMYNAIYLFHIPAMIFLSGYLTGNSGNNNHCSLIRSIVIPLLVFSILYEVVGFAFSGELSSYIKVLTPNWILWFLVSLFFWRVLTPFVLQFRFALIASIAVSLLVSLTSVDGYTYGVFRTIVLFPFYLIGVMFHPFSTRLYNFKIMHSVALVAIVLLIILSLMEPDFNRYFLYCAASFNAAGIANETGVILRLEYYPIAFIAILLFCMGMANMSLFGMIGKSSLHVYLWHGVFVKFFFWPLVQNWQITTGQAIGLALLVSLSLGYSLASKYVVRATNYNLDRVHSFLTRKL